MELLNSGPRKRPHPPGDITAQYLAPNTAYNSSATAKMEIIDKGAIVVSDNWSSLNEHAKDVDENDQDFTID